MLVNPGSVGQPRDNDWRSCYVLLDGDTLRYRRVEYDIETTIRKIYAIPDLDNFLGDRLRDRSVWTAVRAAHARLARLFDAEGLPHVKRDRTYSSRLAQELGIDLRGIRGSERGGRIVMADLRAYIERLRRLAGQPQAAIGQPPPRPTAETVILSSFRM